MLNVYTRVEVLSQTTEPQRLIYAAMHQDYSSDPINMQNLPDETKAGKLVVKHLLAGNRGHFGCLEHPSISVLCGYFPHSVIQQARTHRVGVSFDVQSFRYTSQHLLDAAEGKIPIEQVFYLRSVGQYKDRQGKNYFYSEEDRQDDLNHCYECLQWYKERFKRGYSEEHLRGRIPFEYRQHFIVTFNLRSLLHFFDLRAKLDAQLEIRLLFEQLWLATRYWCPQIMQWYEQNRLFKARLAP